MIGEPKSLKILAWVWLLVTLADFFYVIILNVLHPLSGPDANLGSAFLLIWFLVLFFMLTIVITALRSTKKWLQLTTTLLLGLNPVLFLLPFQYAFYALAPINFIAMCWVLYSLVRKHTN